MIGIAIKSKLVADSAVNALIAGRVYPELAPTGAAYPYIEYATDDYEDTDYYSGGTGLRGVTVTLSCVSSVYSTTADLAQKVKTAMHHQSGTWGGVVVQGAFINGGGGGFTRYVGDATQQQTEYVYDIELLVFYEA